MQFLSDNSKMTDGILHKIILSSAQPYYATL